MSEERMRGIQSVHRTLRAVELLAAHQPIGVAKLARLLGLPKSTTHRVLVTLAEANWIEPTGSEPTRWRLARRWLTLAHLATPELSMRESARQDIVNLGRATNETVHLALLDGLDSMVLIDRVDCDQAVRTWRPLGSRAPLHASSTGLAAIAYLPEAEISTILGRSLERFTEATITEPEELRKELALIRERGYAVNCARNRPNVCAVGAAILNPDRYPLGSVCITMPDFRFDPSRLEEWGKLVSETAATIAYKLEV